MSAEHKALFRRAAQILDARKRYGFGMCAALYEASNGSLTYIECMSFTTSLYYHDGPYTGRVFWMGPEFTEEQRQHRIMALLFAAECFNDMEGV